MDVNRLSDDEGLNARRDQSRPPARYAFEGPLPLGQSLRPPRIDLIDLALGRVTRSIREDWVGTHVCLLLVEPFKGWRPKLSGFKKVSERYAVADLFLVAPAGGNGVR